MGEVYYSALANYFKSHQVLVKWIFIALFYAVSLLIPSIALATEYYVSPTGNDSYLGSKNSPFKTISKGISKLTAGDTLYVRGGTYTEQIVMDLPGDGTALNPIVIMAYPGETPFLDGTNIHFGGGGNALIAIWNEYIIVDGFEIANLYATGIHAAAGADHCIFRNLIVHDGTSLGIGFYADYCIVENCVVYNVCTSNLDGIFSPGEYWSAGIDGKNCTGSIIRNCYVHDVYGEGISMTNVDFCIAEDNIIHDVFSAMLYCMNNQDCLYQRNLVYRTKSMGVDETASGLCHWDEKPLHKNARNTLINNIVYGTRRNFNSGPLIDCIVANNTFMNSIYFACVQTEGGHSGSLFANNIIIQEDSKPCFGYAVANTGLTFSHNLWNKAYHSGAVGTGDVVGDPRLAKTGSTGAGDLTGYYFKLLNTSPAINKGTFISKVTNDFFGNARDASPNIGAHEYTILNQKIPVTGITVTGTGGANTITADNGTLQLSAAISPSNATNKTVTWSIANGTGQATISSAGIVTAVSNGTVTARATATDGSDVYGTLVITISNQVISVAGIIIAGAGGAITITADNGTLQLSPAISPSNATNKTVTWSIANGTGQATISSAGIVTAVSNGTVTARATATDGSDVYGTLVITISNQIIPSDPVYVSSAIENATPAILDMNYSLNLANVLPAVSAFNVYVNSVARTINTVAISGTKVLLTLASQLVYGDIVTVSYTRPATNPLQTASGGQAATIAAQSVTNNVSFINTPPVVVINSPPSNFSGFVGQLDATGSYDLNNDNLSYTWVVPSNISVSATSGSKIKFLSPIVVAPETFEFTLKVSDGKTTQSKTIPVEILPYKQELEVAVVLNVEASGFQSANYPYNILDGNIWTMWTVNGDNQWLIVELKEPFNIQHVKLAFQPGQKRESYFDILGSDDRVTWEPILIKSASCAFSGDIQVFDFPPSKAEKEFKYIKLVGQANSVDSWNYISEFKIFGYKHHNPTSYEMQPVKIYPNPAREFINIRIDETTLKPDFIRIINLSGKFVFQDKVNPDIKDFQIPINLIQGVYIVQMGSGELTLFTQKLVVSK